MATCHCPKLLYFLFCFLGPPIGGGPSALPNPGRCVHGGGVNLCNIYQSTYIRSLKQVHSRGTCQHSRDSSLKPPPSPFHWRVLREGSHGKDKAQCRGASVPALMLVSGGITWSAHGGRRWARVLYADSPPPPPPPPPRNWHQSAEPLAPKALTSNFC